MTKRLVVSIFFCLVALASVHAQTPCSVMTKTLTHNQATQACGTIIPDDTSIAQTYTVKCTNTETQKDYYTATSSLTGTGKCNVLYNCPAIMTAQVFNSGSVSHANTFSFVAQNQSINVDGCEPNGGSSDSLGCGNQACGGTTCTPRSCPTNQTFNFSVCGCVPSTSSPIILDLNGKGFILTNAANGVSFDISGTGQLVQMGWIAQGADNAFLALPGSDGLVHTGKELFGNFTPQPKSDHPNGFAALAVYDDPKNGGNGDGIIDSRDAVFASLRLWIDANHDGICQPEELRTLPSLGINSISLKYREDDKTDQYGNAFRYRARLNPDKATDAGKTAFDVFFVVEGTPTTRYIPSQLVPETTHKCKVPSRQSALSSTGGL